MVMLTHLYENQAERNNERILMETIIQMTYTQNIYVQKKNYSISHLRNGRK